MSSLINRVPTGRIISLHAEIQYLYWRFNDSSFTLQQMKLDPSLEKTQLDFFPLAVSDALYGRYNGKYDPYLDNPLDKAGFHLTQSTERDSQKSKAVSECFSALEGLGWVNRLDDGKGVITKLGIEVAQSKYEDKKFLEIIRRSVLHYGPFIGLLFESYKKSLNGKIKRKNIIVGYTNTTEIIEFDGQSVPISTGSQDDSITRTRSTLLAWAMTAGYLWPVNEPVPSENWHNEALKLLKNKKWTWSEFYTFLPDIFDVTKKVNISRPLSYKWMTKSTKALREKGQGSIRGATLQIESKLKNRRLAVVYLLALASKDNRTIVFKKLIDQLGLYPDLFIINKSDFSRVMREELNQMSVTSGVVFNEDSQGITPLVTCSIQNLIYSAPEELINTLNHVYENLYK
jgi:hypothetical protein